MFNRPTVPWLNDDANQTRLWDSDRAPGLRLIVMWLGAALALLAVTVRLAQLQVVLQEDYVSGFEQTYEVLEDIPARHGRILAADGSILAGEREQYDLQINYRLIQQPADDRWLRVEATRNLDRKARKDNQKVDAEKQKVLKRREELWAAVAVLTQRQPEDLAQARQTVQNRVSRMRDEVLRQRKKRRTTDAAAPATTTLTGWESAWNHIRKELTEPPSRSMDSEPLAEELGYHTILPGVDADVKAEIEAHPERYPGLQIAVTYRRTYPQGELASHLVGTRTPMTAEDVRKRRETNPPPETLHQPGDPIGRSGLERKYDSHLRGIRGQRRLVKNRRGDIVSSEVIREPRHGQDLVLTVDVEIQRHAEQLLDQALVTVTPADTVDDQSNQRSTSQPTCPQGGCIIAIDIHTGAILTAASAPRFDLNLLTSGPTTSGATTSGATAGSSGPAVQDGTDPTTSDTTTTNSGATAGSSGPAVRDGMGATGGSSGPPVQLVSDRQRWDDLMSDPRKPLFSRATQMSLAPGSVFKVISAVAAVESGAIHPDTPFVCRGYLDRPDQHRCLIYRHYNVGHGETRLEDALCRSCNVYFFSAARRMGPQPLVDWSTRFGIGQPTGIDLPSEAKGHLPSPDESVNGQRRRWHVSDTLGLSIGQADLLVTPLQMVRAMAAIANGGLLVTPHLAGQSGPVSMSASSSVRPDFPHPEPQPIPGLHSETLDHIREGLEMVVSHPQGTGFKTVRSKDVRIAGKTGTAETNGPDHAWFAGYAPAEQPRVAFVVVLEHGGSGGKSAGPVAKNFVNRLMDLGLVTPATELVRE